MAGKRKKSTSLALLEEQDFAVNLTVENIIRNLARSGFQEKEISEFIGVKLAALQKKLATIPNLKDSLVEGKDEATQVMVANLFRTAIGGTSTVEVHETINAKGQKSTRIVTKEAAPVPALMMFWLVNQDPENWKTVGQTNVQEKRLNINESQPESDKIARLSREVFSGDTFGVKREYRVSQEVTHATGKGTVDERDVPANVPRETTDYFQDDVVDFSAEEGTE